MKTKFSQMGFDFGERGFEVIRSEKVGKNGGLWRVIAARAGRRRVSFELQTFAKEANMWFMVESSWDQFQIIRSWLNETGQEEEAEEVSE